MPKQIRGLIPKKFLHRAPRTNSYSLWSLITPYICGNSFLLILRSLRLPELNPISLSLSKLSVPELTVVKASAHRQGQSMLTPCASSCLVHTH